MSVAITSAITGSAVIRGSTGWTGESPYLDLGFILGGIVLIFAVVVVLLLRSSKAGKVR